MRTSTTDTYFAGLVAREAGEYRRAERCLRAVIAARPRHADALHVLALVAQTTSRPRLATRLFEAACRLQPANAMFAFNCGNAYFQSGRHLQAIAAWKRSAALDPGDDDPWRNIGLTCAENGDLAGAEEAFRRVLAMTPDAYDIYRRLSVVARRAGKVKEACEWSARAGALAQDPDALARLAGARVNSGRTAEGVRHLKRATRLRPHDAGFLFQLAGALLCLRRTRQAQVVCDRALSLEPSNRDARFLQDALAGRTPARPPQETIAALFDRVANRFDDLLVGQLKYRAPSLVWRATRDVLRRSGHRTTGLEILDAGCGTGLAARLLRPSAKRLVGIDLSAGMLEKARERKAYDRLLHGELIHTLQETHARYDIVFAADVFVYVGDLGPAFQGARRALRPAGLLAFSVEVKDGEGYCLNPTQRYAHSLAHLRQTARAHHFSVRHARRNVLRYEAGAPVRGAVVVLQASNPGAL